MDVYDEVGDVFADLNFYNHVILSIANSHRTYSDVDEAFEKVKGILAKMKEKLVKPNAQTLCNVLKVRLHCIKMPNTGPGADLERHKRSPQKWLVLTLVLVPSGYFLGVQNIFQRAI